METNHNYMGSIQTPLGEIRVAESPDKEYPGVVVMLISNETGKELCANVTEFDPIENRVVLRVYSPDDPDGEPCARHQMSPHHSEKQEG